MTITPELIAAATAVLVSLLSGVDRILERYRNSQKDERAEVRQERAEIINGMRNDLNELKTRFNAAEKELEGEKTEKEEMRLKIIHLTRENAWLKMVLSSKGITIPPMPEDWAN